MDAPARNPSPFLFFSLSLSLFLCFFCISRQGTAAVAAQVLTSLLVAAMPQVRRTTRFELSTLGAVWNVKIFAKT